MSKNELPPNGFNEFNPKGESHETTNYRDAMRQVREVFLRIWGSFSDVVFPDNLAGLEKKSQKEAQRVLLSGARIMKGALDKDQVGPAEYNHFLQEYEVVCLLLLLCAWGAFEEEIPITTEDVGKIREAMQDLAAAGESEPGRSVMDTAQKVIRKGLATRQLPREITNLLGASAAPE